MSGNSPPSSDTTTSHQSQPHTDVKPRPNSKTTSFHDCWSQEATFTLIQAWGDRILKLNTGSLRQNHWQEVADAVNARHAHVKKPRRTSVQCKNRIDTLKKKYKVEKALGLELGSGCYVSTWPFFKPLDSLIGSAFKPSIKTPTPPVQRTVQRKRTGLTPAVRQLPPPPSSVPVGRRSKRPPPPPFQPSSDGSFFRRNFSVMAAAAAAVDGADDRSDTSSSSGGNRNRNRNRNRNLNRNGKLSRNWNLVAVEDGERSGDPYHELAEAIGRFADVYKRVEEVKQRQVVELEKQRMQFTKDLELERMKLLMESQVELRKLKRLKGNSNTNLCKSDGSASVS